MRKLFDRLNANPILRLAPWLIAALIMWQAADIARSVAHSRDLVIQQVTHPTEKVCA